MTSSIFTKSQCLSTCAGVTVCTCACDVNGVCISTSIRLHSNESKVKKKREDDEFLSQREKSYTSFMCQCDMVLMVVVVRRKKLPPFV